MPPFIVPSGIKYPKRKLLMPDGQWEYLYVLLRSERPHPAAGFQCRTAYLCVPEETIDEQHATFRWSPDAADLTYDDLVADAGLGSRPVLRVCVYGPGKNCTRTWYPPLEAYRLLGLKYVPQQQQEKQEKQQQEQQKQDQQRKQHKQDQQQELNSSQVQRRQTKQPTTAAMTKGTSSRAPKQPRSGSQTGGTASVLQPPLQQLSRDHEAAGGTPQEPPGLMQLLGVGQSPHQTIQFPIFGDCYGSSSSSSSKYSMSSLLGGGAYTTVKLLQLVQGPPTAPQQLAYKQLREGASGEALARETQVLQLLYPNPLDPYPNPLDPYPFVTKYYGSYNGNLVLEYCSQGTLSSYCKCLQLLLKAQDAMTNLTGIWAQLAAEAMAPADAWPFTAAASALAPAQPSSHGSPSDVDHIAPVTTSVPAVSAGLAPDSLQRVQAVERSLRSMMSDALFCLSKLHAGMGICSRPGVVVTHNNLTPEHLLVAQDGRLRLAGWGHAHVATALPALAAEASPPDTSRYTAPEKLDGSATPSTFPKGDVWSLLQIWCALLANCCPFYFIAGEPNQLSELYSGPDAQARLEQLMDAHYTHLLPPAALAFFKWGLQVDPQQRPRAVEVLGHPYMQGRVVGAGRSEGLVLA